MARGHHSDGSGVQKHSAGANYPFVPFVRGEQCFVLHPNGREELVSTITVNDRVDRTACIGMAIDRACWRAAELRGRK